MQKMKKILGLLNLILFLSLSGSSFAGDKTWVGKTFYLQTNIKAKPLRGEGYYHAPSTNFIGFKELVPVNSECVVKSVEEGESMDLNCKGMDMPLHLEYIKKHSLVGFEEYLNETIAAKPLDMKQFSKRELELIKGGDFELGMSRKALLTSLGIPPRSLNGNLQTGKNLIYQKMRFNKYRFDFDDKDKLEKVKN